MMNKKSMNKTIHEIIERAAHIAKSKIEFETLIHELLQIELNNRYFNFDECDLNEIEQKTGIKYRFFRDQCPNTELTEYVIKFEYIHKGKKHIAFVNKNFHFIFPVWFNMNRIEYEAEKKLFWSLFNDSTVEKHVFLIQGEKKKTMFQLDDPDEEFNNYKPVLYRYF